MNRPLERRLDLFLADADQRRPVLEEGLPSKAALLAPRPTSEHIKELRRIEENWNDLSLQGWALIAPEGKAGDRMLEAIEPLRKLREAEGAPVKVYRAPADMSAKQAVAWKTTTFWPEGVPEDEVPLYALLLGDLDELSAELQHVLAAGSLVGRLSFAKTPGEADLDAYAAYADKIVRFAREGTAHERPDFLFYVAPDGSSATVCGRELLVAPGLEASRQRLAAGKLAAASVRELSAESVEALLVEGASGRPSVLLSVSHGLGAPPEGWPSAEEQRRKQGALLLVPDQVLDAERLRGQAFLPGGMWFLVACFGAGTPASSAYHAWLTQLAEGGDDVGSIEAIKRSLSGGPFVAALPQAALANKAGPLAVIGHLDLAWTASFSGIEDPTESKKSRILLPLEKLVAGNRAGVALGALMREYADVNDTLMSEYQRMKDAEVNGRRNPVAPLEQAYRWLLRNDLRGYVLLGDPAARLPLSRFARQGEGAGAPVG
ncbi:MAG: hypothetical protein MUF34_33520 [Polyangiaceae bacterium]|nr:hypothetical protein [Polyangiaceae bacterium]